MPKNVPAQAVAETAPDRSPARAILAARLAAKANAAAQVDKLVAADRKLDGLRKEAEQLAADVAAGEGGASAAELALALVTVNAKIVSSGPERARLSADMLVAGQALSTTVGASQIEVTQVLHEELEILGRQIEDMDAQIHPYRQRLAGLRSWALSEGHTGGEDKRTRHLKLMDAATAALHRLCPTAVTDTGGTEAQWNALNENLMHDADARL